MIKELWKKSVEFHGHECPGLAIGFKACEAAMEMMGLTFLRMKMLFVLLKTMFGSKYFIRAYR